MPNDPAYPAPPQGPTPVRTPNAPAKDKPTDQAPDGTYHGGKDPDPSKT